MIVLFDLDGTLTRRDTYLPFLGLCLKQFRIRRLSLAALSFHILLYKFGIIDNHQLKEIFLERTLSGITLEDLKPVAERFVLDLIDSGLRKPVIQRLNAHLNEGDKVILVTASFDFYVIKLARKIGINHVVCTRAEVNDGILTGRILGKNCHGEEKVRRLENLLSESDWDFSVLYTDHYSDHPLLKKVNKGILVEPGFKTRSLLKKDNITIMQ